MSAPPRSIRYIGEDEMESLIIGAAKAGGAPDDKAAMIGAIGRNIYGIGCTYPMASVRKLEQICLEPAKEGEAWALLMLQCARGKLPRLRSESTASARMRAARKKRVA